MFITDQMKYLISLLLLALLFVACTSPKEEAVEETTVLSAALNTYYLEVMEQHDTAMLLMKDIAIVRHQLREYMKSVEATDTISKTILIDLLKDLQKADDGMMTWMRYFKSTSLDEAWYKKEKETTLRTYLAVEEKKIQQVHVDMINSIKAGKLYLSTK
jgi:PBP1b-binding outer membrane lipoprotein LpoB